MLSERSSRLSFDELEQIAQSFVALGVRKIRLTGGEPLLRPELSKLVERLARLDLQDLCLTTNGSLLTKYARDLVSAGLSRVTVSLDAIDSITFERMTDSRMSVSKVLAGIEAARLAGLNPVKINMVVKRGGNDHCIVPMADWARREGLELRFIEYMDVGRSNGWCRTDVVEASEILETLHRHWPIRACEPLARHETAERFAYQDGQGKFGIVASITKPFCGDCTRARVSSTGHFYPCLFAPFGHDLATPLRENQDLKEIIGRLWESRIDRYSEFRATVLSDRPRPEMSAIGG
jgi:cyclic pyranopterin phosphate synthase